MKMKNSLQSVNSCTNEKNEECFGVFVGLDVGHVDTESQKSRMRKLTDIILTHTPL